MLHDIRKNYLHFNMVNAKDISTYILTGWYIDSTGKRVEVCKHGQSFEKAVAKLMNNEHDIFVDDAQLFGGFMTPDCDVTTKVREHLNELEEEHLGQCWHRFGGH
jgi:hypothetical protein